MMRLMSRDTPPRSRPCTSAENVDDGLDVIVRHDGNSGAALDGSHIGENGGRGVGAGAGNGNVFQILQGIRTILRGLRGDL